MLVIADASPLNVLVRIGKMDILPQLFGQVVIPPAVFQELSDEHTPPVISEWVHTRPDWLIIRSPATVDITVARGAGEREAICLARELNADLLLVDDLPARSVAVRLGLTVTGTLGVLELAAARGLLSLPVVVDLLRQTDFRISDRLLNAALARDAERQRPSP